MESSKTDIFHSSVIVATGGDVSFTTALSAITHEILTAWGQDIIGKEVNIDILVDEPGKCDEYRIKRRDMLDTRCHVSEKMPRHLTQDYLYNIAMMAGRSLVKMAEKAGRLDNQTLHFMLDVKQSLGPVVQVPDEKQKAKLLHLEGSITDAITDLLNYNRKDDEELTVRDVEVLIEKGLLTRGSLKKLFNNAVEQAFDENFKDEEEVYKTQTGT